MTSSFFADIVKEIGNDYAGIAADGVAAGDIESYIDTGSYIFNAVLSGSIFGGLPSNKITALAGESSTGKTFYKRKVVWAELIVEQIDFYVICRVKHGAIC